jgi:hypothetical protein
MKHFQTGTAVLDGRGDDDDFESPVFAVEVEVECFSVTPSHTSVTSSAPRTAEDRQEQQPDDVACCRRPLTKMEIWNLTFSLLAWACTVSNLVLGEMRYSFSLAR